MKTYVIIVSSTFPSTHQSKGQNTHFKEKIEIGLGRYEATGFLDGISRNWTNIDVPKIHTIRSNYPLWEKRISKVLKYEAIISLRYWELPGGCYTKGNKQIEIARLSADDNIGIQELRFEEGGFFFPTVIVEEGGIEKYKRCAIDKLAKADGLSFEDFEAWFKGYDLSKSMPIIHFTNFRY